MGAHSGAEYRPVDGAGVCAECGRPAAVLRKTPFLTLDVAGAVRAYGRIRAGLAGIEPHYAVKCQPHPVLLRALAAAGACFEVASPREIAQLTRLGVPGRELVYSHPVKSMTEIALARRAGVWVYAFDSAEELVKLAAAAPGAGVVVRLEVAAGSEVASGGKFGVDPVEAARLLVLAKKKGLDPIGIGWHVGSQCHDPGAWVAPIEDAARVMRAVRRHGVKIRLIDVGGGFPARYAFDPGPPGIETYGRVIRDALDALLPYEVERVLAEPGRAVAAEAGTLFTRVRGVTRHGGKRFAHLEVGAWHGIPEGLETGCGIPWPVMDSREETERDVFDLTGPSCDGMDTFARGVELSAGLRAGDLVVIGCAGAYSYGGGFNGFDGPYVVPVGLPVGAEPVGVDGAGRESSGMEGAGSAGGSAFFAGSPAEPAPGSGAGLGGVRDA